MKKKLVQLSAGILLVMSSVTTAFADKPTPPVQVLRGFGDCARADKAAEECQVGGMLLPSAGLSWLSTPPEHDPF